MDEVGQEGSVGGETETCAGQQLMQRRHFLILAIASASLPLLKACVGNISPSLPAGLLPADENGVRLPEGMGLHSRVVARSGQSPVAGGDYIWHGAPDGGACFASEDGGWVYVSNCELSDGEGGVGALRFNAEGQVIAAYPILHNSNRNCAGGVMPWGTWMSCEESGDQGRVFECDPAGNEAAREIPALGRFNHEAVAYDTRQHQLYLTEDRFDGGFYRFIPSKLSEAGYADLDEGVLQVAQIKRESGKDILYWHVITDPLAKDSPTRSQVKLMTPFRGGEGVVYYRGQVFFTTKFDNSVWAYDTDSGEITRLYQKKRFGRSVLSGVDNVTVDKLGNILVAEDGGDMQIVSLGQQGQAAPLLQLVGQDKSEICGPAFSPDGSRLYFSSQRGVCGDSSGGLTYEISGFTKTS